MSYESYSAFFCLLFYLILANVNSFQVMTGQTEGAAIGVYGNGGCFFGTLCGGGTYDVGGVYFRPDHHFDENGNIKPKWRGLEFRHPPIPGWTWPPWSKGSGRSGAA